MSYGEFEKKIVNAVRDGIAEDDRFTDAVLFIKNVDVVDRSYKGLTIKREGVSVSPIANLDNAYEMFVKGIAFDKIVEVIIDTIGSGMESIVGDAENIVNYDSAKKRLFIEMMPMIGNEEVLRKYPYKQIGDMAAIYNVLLNIDDNGEMARCKVTNELLEKYAVTKEELHKDAVKSHFDIFPETVFPMPFVDLDEPVLVIGNSKHCYGASAICNEELLEKVAEVVGDPFYIIPSSIDEIIALSLSFDAKWLMDSILEVNRDIVEGQGRKLSDTLYIYEAGAVKELSIDTGLA